MPMVVTSLREVAGRQKLLKWRLINSRTCFVPTRRNMPFRCSTVSRRTMSPDHLAERGDYHDQASAGLTDMNIAYAGIGLGLVLVAGVFLLPGDATENRKLLETFRAEFVEITPGEGKFPREFVMGTEHGPYAEEPAHKVTMSRSFAIARYEVPQNLFEAITGANPSRWKGKRNSVESFTFAEAKAFCAKVTTQLREARLIEADQEVRLPTEAEWEYCCRAGTTTPYSFGESAVGPNDTANKATLLDPYAWHTGNAAGNDPEVGVLKPNPWGLYDMHGYLWEFVEDAWHDTYASAPADSSAWASTDAKAKRVLRGGSWKERYECHRSAYRRPVTIDEASDAIGFRCVLAKVPGK
jgi:formylglycine-generating enzyme required for sulfatase activity